MTNGGDVRPVRTVTSGGSVQVSVAPFAKSQAYTSNTLPDEHQTSKKTLGRGILGASDAGERGSFQKSFGSTFSNSNH